MRAAAPGRAAGGEATEELDVLTIDLVLAALDQRGARQGHQVLSPRERALVTAERLAQEPLRAVARHRAPELPARGQSQTVVSEIVVARHQAEKRPVDPEPPAQDAPVIRAAPQPLPRPQPGVPGRRTGQAPILLRPFCRRLLSTRRPPLVLMRTRNPCVRFRFRLLGWNVRFMLNSPVPVRPALRRPGSAGAKGQVYATCVSSVKCARARGALDPCLAGVRVVV